MPADFELIQLSQQMSCQIRQQNQILHLEMRPGPQEVILNAKGRSDGGSAKKKGMHLSGRDFVKMYAVRNYKSACNVACKLRRDADPKLMMKLEPKSPYDQCLQRHVVLKSALRTQNFENNQTCNLVFVIAMVVASGFSKNDVGHSFHTLQVAFKRLAHPTNLLKSLPV